MKKRIFSAFLSLLSTIILVEYTHAQITIGNTEPPVKGALLQLKNIDGATDGGRNATKGLILPRVNLSLKNELIIGGIKYPDPLERAGLVVYAVDDFGHNPTLCKGVYVWNGEEWEGLLEGSEYNHMSPSNYDGILSDVDGNQYYYKNFNGLSWMLTNLRTTKNANGDSFGEVHMNPANESDSLNAVGGTIMPPRVYLNKEQILSDRDVSYQENKYKITLTADEFASKFGLLYSYEQRTDACPTGWRLPTYDEVKSLIEYVGGSVEVIKDPGAVDGVVDPYALGKYSTPFKANNWDYTPADKPDTARNWGGYSVCDPQNTKLSILPTGYVNGNRDARLFGISTYLRISDPKTHSKWASYINVSITAETIAFMQGHTNHRLSIRCVR